MNKINESIDATHEIFDEDLYDIVKKHEEDYIILPDINDLFISFIGVAVSSCVIISIYLSSWWSHENSNK